MAEVAMELMKRFRLQAAHWLPEAAPDDPERRVHGHSFAVEVWLKGPLDPELGWVVDFAEITAAFAPIFKVLDHHPLNEEPGLEHPTAQTIAAWIYQRLEGKLPWLDRVVVGHGPAETASCGRRSGVA